MAWPVARFVDPARSGCTVRSGTQYHRQKVLTIAQPGDIAWKSRVQRTGSDEHTCVNNAGSCARNAHDETDGHDTQANQNERVSLSHAIAVPSHGYRQHRGCDIDRHGQELRRGAGVAEASDDGWKE